MVDVKKIALFVGGVVFGSATAAGLRMKDSTMETGNKVQ